MDIRADLHLHTVASDGRWTPEQLIAEVQQAGIGLFAITDHDSIGSLGKAVEKVQGSGLRFLPGVELSAQLNGHLCHLLAYGFDLADSALSELISANNGRLADSNDEAVRILARAGYPVSWDDYATYTWDRSRGGWKSFNYLLDRGLCRDVRGYFDDLFGEIGHPQPDFSSPDEVIPIVRRAGGVVVLAHPGATFHLGLGAQHLDQLLEMGVEGLECYSPHHDEATTRTLLDYCRSRNLFVTGGSDCHGGFAGRPLGKPSLRVSDLTLGVLEERVIS